MRRLFPLLLVCLLTGCNRPPSTGEAIPINWPDSARERLAFARRPRTIRPLATDPPPPVLQTSMLLAPKEQKYNPVLAVAFSPDGQTFVLAGEPEYNPKPSDPDPKPIGRAHLWNVTKQIEVRHCEVDNESIYAVAFSPDGGLLASGTGPRGRADDPSWGRVYVWRLHDDKPPLRIDAHAKTVGGVAFSPDGRQLLTGSDDATLRIWDLATGKEVRRFEGHTAAVTSVAWHPNGRFLVSGSAESFHGLPMPNVRLWDSRSGEEVRRFDGHSQTVNALAFTPDGSRLLTASDDGTVCVWDTETGKELLCFQGHSLPVRIVSVSADGRRVLSGGSNEVRQNNPMLLWDLDTGQILGTTPSFSEPYVCALAPDGARAVSAGDRMLRVWTLPH
jgi:WD40 repeat protein